MLLPVHWPLFDAALVQIPAEGLAWREEENGWTVQEIVRRVGEDRNVYVLIIERALAAPVGSFPDRWDSAVKFHDVSGKERQGRNTVRTMLEMLTEHMQEHTGAFQRIAEAAQV